MHVSEISAEKRIHHPQDVLRAGQVVKAQVLAIDGGKRQIKLSMKQLIPTSIDEYIAEHKAGDVVSGRVVEESGSAIVELGEGIRSTPPVHQRFREYRKRQVPAQESGFVRAFMDAEGAVEGRYEIGVE